MLEIVISCGQTGAEQAGWRAAHRCGIATGWFMPKGWLTEDGPRPDFAAEYGALEHADGYPDRTRANVAWAGAIVWYGGTSSPGGRLTLSAARAVGCPLYVVGDVGAADPPMVATWIGSHDPAVLMVAGNRASKATIRDDQIEKHLEAVFALLGFAPTGGPGD